MNLDPKAFDFYHNISHSSMDLHDGPGVQGIACIADATALQDGQHVQDVLDVQNAASVTESKFGIRSEDCSFVFSHLEGSINVGANMEVVLNIENLHDGVPYRYLEDLKDEIPASAENMEEPAINDQERKQSPGLALWVKWRGKWQAGIQCSIDDCPGATVKAMPTYGRKTYIVVYFPNTRTHCWTDSQLACTISEKPEPLAYGTHESGQEMVKDLGTPRRYMLQKLAVAMLEASDQLHVEAVVESARNVNVWKDFAKEASQCTIYSDLGRMLLKLHSMILEMYISHSWMNTFDTWKQQCENTETAESTEKLTKELVDAILWDDVAKLWDAPVQPGLGPEWKTWKKEVMKWFSTSNPSSTSGYERNHDRESREEHVRTNDGLDATNLEVGKKRQKLEIRRGEMLSSEVQDLNGSRFYAPGEVFYSPFVPYTSGYQLVPYTNDSTPMKEDDLVMKNRSITRIQASHTDRGYRRCSAFMEKKGRKCNRWATDGGIYCCKHLDFQSTDNGHLADHGGSFSVDAQTDPNASICEGMTKYGRRCTHRKRNGTSFCLKHMLQDGQNLEGTEGTPCLSALGNSYKRAKLVVEGQSPEKNATSVDLYHQEKGQNEPKFTMFSGLGRGSGSSAQKWDNGSNEDERHRCVELQSRGFTVPERAATKVPNRSTSWSRCIGSCRNHGGQCSHRAKQGSSYCEKHFPGSVGNGVKLRHRLVSSYLNGIFKSTSSEEDGVDLCRSRDLLDEYMNACLSEGATYHSYSENRGLDWVLDEVSENMKDAEALLKMVTAEKEKLGTHFGFGEQEKSVTATVPRIAEMQENLGPAASVDNGRAVHIPVNGMDDSGSVCHNAPNKTENLKCKGCAEDFVDLQALSHHCITIHKKAAQWHFRGYACRKCSSSFTNKKGLERHVKIHHAGISLELCTEYFCIPCGSRFMNCDQLLQHVVLIHSEELNQSIGVKELVRTTDSLMPLEAEQSKQNEPVKSGSPKRDLSSELDFQRTIESNHNCLYTPNVIKGEGENRSFVRDSVKRFSCRFCGLKFSLLPDLGRHHQAQHMGSSSTYNSHRNRRKDLTTKWRANKGNFRMTQSLVGYKHAAVIARKKRLKNFDWQRPIRFKGSPHRSDQSEINDRSTESYCSAVAEMLLSEGQKTRPCPNNLEILNVARLACCRINLHAALEEKYGMLPEKLYIKAARLCSEENIRVEWHREDFICPKGCMPKADSKPLFMLDPLPDVCFNPLPVRVSDLKLEPKELDPVETWEKAESHLLLNSSNFKRSGQRRTIVLLEDLSFGQEAVAIPCVMDEDAMTPCYCPLCKDGKCQHVDSYRPWENFSYITERLLDPSLGLDTKSSQLGCTCAQPQCSPESCDHVYLFENDNDDAEDIYGKPMHGRFPYNEKGQIILEKGLLVYECNSLCSCKKECQNRVLQKGVRVKLEVYKTRHKGWAVRAAQTISRGTFICEYNGEVLNDQEANKRGESYDKDGCSYLYDIDPHIDANKFMEGTKPYVIDATRYGNVARFINHSCSPNLVNYQVLVESMDCQLAHIGLYASRDIAVGEELAYDYHYKLLPGNGSLCLCGAENCRGRLY
eukprot:Gb_27710 [translate_table: standard]